MSETSIPNGFDGGDVIPHDKRKIAKMRAGVKALLMAALSRADQISSSKDLLELAATISRDTEELCDKVNGEVK